MRVIAVTGTNAAERALGLDLGAGDVSSCPWAPEEILARIRAQLRTKREEDELRAQGRTARQGSMEHQNDHRRITRCNRAAVRPSQGKRASFRWRALGMRRPGGGSPLARKIGSQQSIGRFRPFKVAAPLWLRRVCQQGRGA
jgi:hypothetical protein